MAWIMKRAPVDRRDGLDVDALAKLTPLQISLGCPVLEEDPAPSSVSQRICHFSETELSFQKEKWNSVYIDANISCKIVLPLVT